MRNGRFRRFVAFFVVSGIGGFCGALSGFVRIVVKCPFRLEGRDLCRCAVFDLDCGLAGVLG